MDIIINNIYKNNIDIPKNFNKKIDYECQLTPSDSMNLWYFYTT